MELDRIVFTTDTSELSKATDAIGTLVQEMSKISTASANMAKIQAQTEAILARAASSYADARKKNAEAADKELRSAIAADKADQQREKSTKKAAEAVDQSTDAIKKNSEAASNNVSILQRQTDILEFQAQGWSKGQAGILATAKAAKTATEDMQALMRVLETQRKLMGTDPFDKSMSGLKSLQNQYSELKESVRQYNAGTDLTMKQTKELARDKQRILEQLKVEGASFSEVRAAIRSHNEEYKALATQYNKLAETESSVIRQRKEMVSSANYVAQAEQKMSAALNTANAAIDKSGTDLLVKYENALIKAGFAQDIVTQKLAAYKNQLQQVQAQEQKRAADNLSRAVSPQLTDIAVSLYSGQAPLTVLLQQGGQLADLFRLSGVEAGNLGKLMKESFYSMIPVVKEVSGALLGLASGIFVDIGRGAVSAFAEVTLLTSVFDKLKKTIVSGGEENFKYISTLNKIETAFASIATGGIVALLTLLVTIGLEYKKIIQTENELSKALATSGGVMGLSKDAAVAYSESLKEVGIGALKAQEAITEFSKSGKVGTEGLDAIIKSAVELEKTVGTSLEDTAKQFTKLQDAPTKALTDIAIKTGLVDSTVLDLVRSLESQGKTAEAAELATLALASANLQMAIEYKDNLTPIEELWNNIKTAVGKVKAEIHALSTSNAVVSSMKTVWETVSVVVAETWFTLKGVGKEIGGIAAQIAAVMRGDFAGAKTIGEQMKIDAASARKEQDALIKSILDRGTQEGKFFNDRKAQNSAMASWNQENEKALAKSLSKKEQFSLREKQLQKDLQSGLINEAKYNEAIAGWKRVIFGYERESKAKKEDSYYATTIKKFRDETIQASTASDGLVKSQVELLKVISDPKFLALSKSKKEEILQTAALTIQAEKLAEAKKDQNDADELSQKIMGKSEGLGKQYYETIDKILSFQQSGKYTQEHVEELIRTLYNGTPVVKEYAKSLEEAQKALNKYNEESIASQADSSKENLNLDLRLSLLGKTTEQQKILQREHERSIKLSEVDLDLAKKKREIELNISKARKDNLPEDGKELQGLTSALEQADRDAAEKRKVINRDVAVQYAEDVQKEFDRISGGITDSIVTALFEGGTQGAASLRSLIVNELKKPVTLVVQAVVNTLLGDVIGGLVGGGVTGGSAGGKLQTASNLNSLFGTVTQGLFGSSVGASTASLFGANAVGMAGGDALGALIAANGQWAGVAAGATTAAEAAVAANLALEAGAGIALETGTLATAAAEASAATAASSTGMLAAIPGWGWALAGAALLLGSMDFSGEQRFGGGYQLNGNKEVKYTAGPGGGQINQEAQEAIVNETYKSVNSILKSLGSTLEVIDFYAGLETSGKGKGGTFAGGKLSSGTEFGKKWQAGMYYQDLTAEEAVKQFAGQMKIVMVEALKAATDIPVYLQDELKKVDLSKLTADTAGLVIQELEGMFTTFSTVKDAFEILNKPMFDATTAGYQLTESFIALFGGLDGFKNSVNSYYDNFFSETEKELNVRNKLTESLSEQNIQLPKTREEYRKLTEAQDLNTEAGREVYATLIKNAGAFAELTPVTETVSKQITGMNKVFNALSMTAKVSETKFSKSVKEMFESLGLSVEDYSNSISSVIEGVVTGKIKAEDAGKELADAAVGGITNAIAQGASQAIAAQFVSSIISPVIANIMAGKTALDGIDMQAGLDNLKSGTEALKIVLNTLGPELSNAFSGLAGNVVDGANTAIRMIARTSKFAIGGSEVGSSTVIYSQGPGSTLTSGTNQYGGVGDSRFAVGGSSAYFSNESQSLRLLTEETIASNNKVSELLQKLLNPEKLFGNRYEELVNKLEEKRNEKIAVQGAQGARGESLVTTIKDLPAALAAAQEDIDKFKNTLAEWKTQDWGDYTAPENILKGMEEDLRVRTEALKALEKDLQEWYLAQARLIAVEDMTSLTKEIADAKTKTKELKSTGGIDDPIKNLKDAFSDKLKAINDGINSALQKEIDSKKSLVSMLDPEFAQQYQDWLQKGVQPENYKDFTEKGKAFEKLLGFDLFTGLVDLPLESIRQRIEKLKNVLPGLDAEITALTEEQQKYITTLEDWYKAQAELLSTEMLVDINNQIKALETEEKGPLSTIKDAIQKYLNDFTELGTLTDDIQAQLDKLSDLQLTKAREELYNQLIPADEMKQTKTLKLTEQFTELGKTLPASADELRKMIDAAREAGNITLADSLLELIPAFMALQDAANGVNAGVDAANKAFEVLQRATEARIKELEKTFTATDLAMKVLERVVESEKKRLNEELKTAQESVNTLKKIFDTLTNGIKTLRGEVQQTKGLQVQEARRVIDTANLTGILPDAEALADAVSTLTGSVQQGLYATSYDKSRAFLTLANDLEKLKSTAEPQLTSAEQTVLSLETQIKQLDSILESARKQLDELRGIDASLYGIDESIALVDAALQQLQTAYQAEEEARVQINTLNAQLEAFRVQIDILNGIDSSVKSVEDAVRDLQNALSNAVKPERPPTTPPVVSNDGDMFSGYVKGAVSDAYQSILGREADQAGLEWWTNAITTGQVSLSDLEAALDAGRIGSDIPAFASGGQYQGGLALVGEQGPELINFSNPGMVYTAAQSSGLMNGSNAELIFEIKALRSEVIMLRAEARATAINTSKSTRILDDVTQGGDSFKTTAV